MEYGRESVRVRRSTHGLGVFSSRPLHAHERIGPIEGEVMEDPLYESDYCMELGPDSAIEPDPPFRYLNHSCRPNCALTEIETEFDDGTAAGPQLWLETQADIGADEEMTIDYAWPARSAIPCTCGCPECRGWIVAAQELDQIDREHRP
jgi:uncharacterized protein